MPCPQTLEVAGFLRNSALFGARGGATPELTEGAPITVGAPAKLCHFGGLLPSLPGCLVGRP